METLVEEGIQDEQLTDDVDDVKQFDEQVEGDEVITASSTTQEANSAGETVLEADGAARAHLPLTHEIPEEINCSFMRCRIMPS